MTATATVTLSTPLDAAAGPVSEVRLREPKAGELRGVKLAELMQGEPAAVIAVAARVCDPPLTEAALAQLSARNLIDVYEALAGFFVGAQTPPA